MWRYYYGKCTIQNDGKQRQKANWKPRPKQPEKR